MITQVVVNQDQVKVHRGISQSLQAVIIPGLGTRFRIPKDFTAPRRIQRIELVPRLREIELVTGMNWMRKDIHLAPQSLFASAWKLFGVGGNGRRGRCISNDFNTRERTENASGPRNCRPSKSRAHRIS